MPETEPSFDWEEFTRFSWIVAGFVVVVLGSQYVLPFVYNHFSSSASASTPNALTVAHETSTHASSSLPTLATSSERVINALTIADVIPPTGKFMAANLVTMKLFLYTDGTTTAEYPILTKGRPGTPWETPSGFYSVGTKETSHFSSIGKVYMPYSMQFYGNYFIHGWPYYPDGTPVATSYSGGCIRLSTDDAAKVFAFADKHTALFVYDSKAASSTTSSLPLSSSRLPNITASEYLVADIDTGDVFAEQNAQQPQPIASVTKLMTGLVANEIISFETKVPVNQGILLHPQDAADTEQKLFVIGDLLYPLLMESNNDVADSISNLYGSKGFINWMNTTAKALDMSSTYFADASGVSANDISTPEDLYRLAVYLSNKKSFIFKITNTPQKTIYADDGTAYSFTSYNEVTSSSNFVGGKVGKTTAAKETMLSVFAVPINGATRRVAVIVLQSQDYASDIQKLSQWYTQAALAGAGTNNTACASCILPQPYRKISL